MNIPKERYKKHEHFRYDMKCEMCGEITTYVGLAKKDHSYSDFNRLLHTNMDRTNRTNYIQYDYCDDCKLMTRQVLIAYDVDPEQQT
jgi:hypothetical protein